MKNLYLLRGLPGSGKATLANQIGDAYFGADMYFINENGEYIFDPTDLKRAHQWCQGQVNTAMILNYTSDINSSIVVSNSFTQEWETEPYFKLAETYGYRVFSLIVENRHGGESLHKVPADKIQAMKDRFELKL